MTDTPTQPKLTFEEVKAIVDRIQFMDRTFRLLVKDNGFLLQVQYMEEDVETGKMELQSARKWYVSPFFTETEVVETAFAACRRSMDHVLKEHFLYQGRRVYSPHFHIQARMDMCDAENFDKRIPLIKKDNNQ